VKEEKAEEAENKSEMGNKNKKNTEDAVFLTCILFSRPPTP
jgi:hypothetical protein